MTETELGPNFIPNRYRGVSVAPIPDDVELTEPAMRGYLLGRPAYRRTRFVVARRPGATAIVRVTRSSDTELFSPVVAVDLIAGPDECAYLVDPEADTGIPSVLAELALRRAPGARAVVVQGRYAHVNFIVEPRPLRIVVREVVPPEPAKLLDQARRILAVSESLPPIELVGELTRLEELAARRPDEHYLLPCRGSGGEVPGATVSYLDEHPERGDWTLLGCARSRQIHRWFYGEEPPTVDFCPKQADRTGVTDLLLTKCCLQEEHVESGPGWVSVPWGASLDHVREALSTLVAQEVPAWVPA
ncbi:DUF7714 family protein [Pseudonocardia spinosispora]|uniref:DUF7714 family protein n=1 Tax=Pseudonocardia spinosispora TaxID=103441 RepID=UPI00040865FB|nr:hypothetical protein [Pseudonocardia spinosispora]